MSCEAGSDLVTFNVPLGESPEKQGMFQSAWLSTGSGYLEKSTIFIGKIIPTIIFHYNPLYSLENNGKYIRAYHSYMLIHSGFSNIFQSWLSYL